MRWQKKKIIIIFIYIYFLTRSKKLLELATHLLTWTDSFVSANTLFIISTNNQSHDPIYASLPLRRSDAVACCACSSWNGEYLPTHSTSSCVSESVREIKNRKGGVGKWGMWLKDKVRFHEWATLVSHVGQTVCSKTWPCYRCQDVICLL